VRRAPVAAPFLILLVTWPAGAQTRDPVLDFLYEHLTISQSLDDLNTVNKPARFFLKSTDLADDQDRIWQKDVALGVSLFRRRQSPNPPFNYGLGLQFSEANGARRRIGFQITGIQTEMNRDVTPLTFIKITAPFGFKRDGETHTKGLSAKMYVSINHKRPPTFTQPYAGLALGELFEWTPQVGLEYDDVIAAQATTDEGRVLRTLSSVKADFFPFALTKLGRRVVLSASLAHRYDAVTDFDRSARHHRFADLSAAIGLDSDRNILTLAIDRVGGEDPSAQIDGAPFWRLALALHFAKPQSRAYFAARDRTVLR
jgi:hypothetical protein